MSTSISDVNELLNNFKINASCVEVREHRHFIYYDLKLNPGCRVSKIKNCAKELALGLRLKNAPIIKLISEKGLIRLQGSFRNADMLSWEPRESSSGFLPFLLGETDEGNEMWVDMSQNPHLLVAGTTGSGKSILLHNLIANALQIKDTELFLIDTKRVEFQIYDSVKLREWIPVVAKDYETAVAILEFLVDTMERRYETLAGLNLPSIQYKPNIFSKIFLIVDELADLICLDESGRFKYLMSKLAAKSRASGIYLIMATQRPSVDVVAGVVKANFAGRLACKVSSRTDSQVVLDQAGAEDLMGRGDALFKNPVHDLTRLQIAYADPAKTISRLV